jgi:hypothetical protein
MVFEGKSALDIDHVRHISIDVTLYNVVRMEQVSLFHVTGVFSYLSLGIDPVMPLHRGHRNRAKSGSLLKYCDSAGSDTPACFFLSTVLD